MSELPLLDLDLSPRRDGSLSVGFGSFVSQSGIIGLMLRIWAKFDTVHQKDDGEAHPFQGQWSVISHQSSGASLFSGEIETTDN